MKKNIFYLALVIFAINGCFSQNSEKFNLGFENINSGEAEGWTNFGSPDYLISFDANQVKEGKYAAVIEYNGDKPNFKALAFNLPNYEGKEIKISGYIKTENVTGGHAGLWMRIDPQVGFYNMHDRGITGTTDWQKYEFSLDLSPSETEQIVVGALLVGKGKMWIDDLKVSIDGKNVENLEPYQRPVSKAESDREFDLGSKITNINLDKKSSENLRVLGLVWGFLKYYHPSIATGDYNWDYELFRVLPQIVNKNKSERDEVLTKWIKDLGKFEKGNYKTPTDNVHLLPDLDWLTSPSISKELSDVLLQVKEAKRTDKHYYIDLVYGAQNPVFQNEPEYYQIKNPDAGFRVLTLYKYWNMIQYYFPYKNLLEEDWKDVLEEFIPKFVHSENELKYKLVTLELIGRIHDTHANIWGDSTLEGYFGARYAAPEVKFVENKAVVTGFYNDDFSGETGLEAADIITRINGKKIADIIKENTKITPSSNRPTLLRDLSRRLLRTNDEVVEIHYERNGKQSSKILKTYRSADMNFSKFYSKDKAYFKMLNPDIAYLYLGTVKSEYLPSIFEQAKDTKGLVIDLRCYPSDFMVFTLGEYLMPQATEFAKFSKGSIENPGEFTYSENLSVGTSNKDYYKGKVVILINETTQSNAEYTTMAFRVAPNAMVIGSTTAAADGNVSSINLPTGIRTRISGIGVYYPDGTETQRIGIIPDIELSPTIEGIKQGKDELLEKAIEIIKSD